MRFDPAVVLLLISTATFGQSSNELRRPDAFASIADRGVRSRAMFEEAAKVITSGRCMNCHPAGDHPTQGNDMHVHSPPVTRGVGSCQGCHTEANYTLLEKATYRSIPGHPRWDLAPIEMAWQGKSIGAICQQIKDPAHNGGRSLALLQQHAAKDDLVAWGWQPGAGRDPAPGSQQIFGELTLARNARSSFWPSVPSLMPSERDACLTATAS